MQEALIKAAEAQALLTEAQAGYENAWKYLIWTIIGCVVLYSLVYTGIVVASIFIMNKPKAIPNTNNATDAEPTSLKDRIEEIRRNREAREKLTRNL